MKKLLIGLLGLVIVLVAVALIAPNFIDWNSHKPRITTLVRDFTGRTLSIEGDINLRILPSPALTVSGVRLANVEGATTPDMLRLEQVRVNVDIGALLDRRVAFKSVSLVRPVIVLEITPDGRTSWNLTPGEATPAATAAPRDTDPEGAASDLPIDISLASLRVEEGTVVYRDMRSGFLERVDKINAEIAADSLQGPFRVNGGAVVHGLPLTMEASTGRIADDRPLKLKLNLDLAGGTAGVNFNGALSRLAPDASVEGRLKVGGPNAASLAALFGASDLPPAAARSFSLEGKLGASADAFGLNELSLQLGDIAAGGAINAALGDTPQVEVALRVPKLNLDSLIADKAEATGNQASKPKAKTGDNKPLSASKKKPAADKAFALPQDISIAFDLIADLVEFRGGVIREAALRGGLSNGSIVIERASALLPGSSDASLSGVVQAIDGAPRFEGQIAAASDNFRNLLRWLGVDTNALPADRLRSFSYGGKITASAKSIEIAEFNLRFDASHVNGGLAVALRKKLAFGLSVSVDRLNLDAYLPLPPKPGMGKSKSNPGTKTEAKSATPAAVSGAAVPPGVLTLLDAFDANIEASIGKLTYRKTTARKSHADITLFGDAITVRDISVADFAGIGARLTGALKGLRKTPTVAFDFAVRANDPARFFRFVGEKPPVPVKKLGKLGASGRIEGTLNALAIKGAMDVAGGKISVDGVVKSALATPVYEIGVAVNHPELTQFVRVAAPDYRPAAGKLGRLGVSLRLLGGPGSIQVTELKGDAGPVRFSGGAELMLSGKRPRIGLDLKTSEVLLDLFLPPENKPSPAATRVRTSSSRRNAGERGGAAVGRWSREPLIVLLPVILDAEATIEMAALTKDPFRLQAPRLHAVIQNGRLTVDRLTGRIFDGALEAKAVIDTGSGVPDISASFAMKDFDSRKAVRLLANLDRLKGPVSMAGNLRAAGTSEAALVSSLNGNLNLSGRVQVILKREEKAAVGVAGIANLASVILGSKVRELRKLTPYTQLVVALDQTLGRNPALLTGDFQISRGVARTSNLTLGGTGGKAVTAATVDLPAWRMQSRTDLLDRRGGDPLLTYEMSGPIDNPARTKLGGSLLKSGQGAVQQQVTDPLKRLLPGVFGGTKGQQQPQGSTAGSQPQQQVKPKDVLRGVLEGLIRR